MWWVGGLVGWSVGGLVGWWVGRLVGCRLVGWSVGRLVGWLVGWLVGHFFVHRPPLSLQTNLTSHGLHTVEKISSREMAEVSQKLK